MADQSEIDNIIGQLDLARIGEQIGANPAEVQNAAQAAVPMLLSGMQVNAEDPERQVGLLGALGDHEQRDPTTVDPDEGEKIVRHLVGDNPDEAIRALGGTGAGGDMVKKVLPYIAPIVLSMIAKRMGGNSAGALTGILSSVLGGMASGASPSGHKTPEGMLGGLLSSIFGKK